jgi:hypothetical protein
MLVRLTAKDCETHVAVPNKILVEAELSEANKLAIKEHWGEKVFIANTCFIKV